MQKTLTVQHLDIHGLPYRVEQRKILRYVPGADRKVLAAVVARDDLGRPVTYDLPRGMSRNDATALTNAAKNHVLKQWSFERRQLSLPGIDG